MFGRHSARPCDWRGRRNLGVLRVPLCDVSRRCQRARSDVSRRDNRQPCRVERPARPAIVLARDLHLLPEPYFFGVAHVLNRSGRHIGFLNGEYSVDGWWYYFPYCWLVKTPLPIMALLCPGGRGSPPRPAHRARKASAPVSRRVPPRSSDLSS